MKRKNENLKPKTEENEIFEIDDVSSDEELANLPMIPTIHKSVSLPSVEETAIQRTREWASHQSYDSFPHVFSDTEMSPVSR